MPGLHRWINSYGYLSAVFAAFAPMDGFGGPMNAVIPNPVRFEVRGGRA